MLLGCDFSIPKYKSLADCISISALRCTEILEYALLKRLRAVNVGNVTKSPSTEGIAAIGKSITGIFGWNSSNSAKTSDTTSSSTIKSSVCNNNVIDPNFKQKVYKMRAVLCPIKVRFAMVLADLGLLKEAIAYALDAKNLINEVGVSGNYSNKL